MMIMAPLEPRNAESRAADEVTNQGGALDAVSPMLKRSWPHGNEGGSRPAGTLHLQVDSLSRSKSTGSFFQAVTDATHTFPGAIKHRRGRLSDQTARDLG